MKLANFEVGLDRPFFLIAGPCVIESEQLALDTSGQLKEMTDRLGIPFIYKSSFDKANRSSIDSFRGLGVAEGLRILSEVKKQIGVPVLTDVHEDTNFDEVAEVVDVLQTPAFLCRQTNFILKVCSAGRPVNIKKGQFLAPWDMTNVVDKARFEGGKVWVNKTQHFDNAPEVSWDFYIGGYQPAQKWLKDRKGRALSFEDVKHYQRILKILFETDRVMQTITMAFTATE